jgi:hypothetical protein
MSICWISLTRLKNALYNDQDQKRVKCIISSFMATTCIPYQYYQCGQINDDKTGQHVAYKERSAYRNFVLQTD